MVVKELMLITPPILRRIFLLNILAILAIETSFLTVLVTNCGIAMVMILSFSFTHTRNKEGEVGLAH